MGYGEVLQPGSLVHSDTDNAAEGGRSMATGRLIRPPEGLAICTPY